MRNLKNTFFVEYIFLETPLMRMHRSSCSQIFLKIGVLKKFAIFTGKHLCWSLFSIKLQACNLTKKRFQYKCFPVNIAKFKSNVFIEHVRVIAFECNEKELSGLIANNKLTLNEEVNNFCCSPSFNWCH